VQAPTGGALRPEGPPAPPLVEMEGPGPVDQLHRGLRGDLPAQPSGQVRQRRAALAQRTTGSELPEQGRPAVEGDGPGGPGAGMDGGLLAVAAAIVVAALLLRRRGGSEADEATRTLQARVDQTAASMSELLGKFEERRRLEEQATGAVGRIERLVAGSWSRGRAGENLLAAALGEFPPDMVLRDFTL